MAARSTRPRSASSDRASGPLSLLELARSAARSGRRLSLTDPHSGQAVPLSEELQAALIDVAEAVAAGRKVQIAASAAEIGTQEAARILGLSRPTVVKLIESGELKARVPGVERRRLLLEDVLAYKADLFERRTAFIAESSEMFEPVDNAVELIHEVRKRS